MLNFGSLFAVPRSRGAIFKNEKVRQWSLGADIIGVIDVRRSNIDDETVAVYWPIYSHDRVCWHLFTVKQSDITLIPIEGVKKVLEGLVKTRRYYAEHSDRTDAVVLRSARGIIPSCNIYEEDYLLLLLGQIEKRCIRSNVFPWPFSWRKVEISSPYDVYWPALRIEEMFRDGWYHAGQVKVGDSYYRSIGFKWMEGKEPIVPEELLVINDHQALRLAEEYRDQLYRFIEPLESAFSALRITRHPDPLPRPKTKPAHELIATSAPTGRGTELEAATTPSNLSIEG